MKKITRREAITTSALVLGGTLIGSQVLLTACSAPEKGTGLFSVADIKFLDEIGETILPATASSPGAREVSIGKFMQIMVTDCFDSDNQKIFLEGIIKLDDFSRTTYNKKFMNLSGAEKQDLLVTVDEEAKKYGNSKPKNAPRHYFSLMKELTLKGYFTSEPGATKALRYVPIPGRYDGCVDYAKGDPAWAT